MRHAILIALSLLAVACIDERCDPNQEFVVGLCFDFPPDAGVADRDAGPPESSVPFNTVCTDTAQCGGVTDLCAIQPGQGSGFCTHTGCLEDPSVCPADASCLDLAPYGFPDLSICVGGA